MCGIKLVKVDEAAACHKGFDWRGCYGSPCADACCRNGADVDRESYQLMMNCRVVIEEKLGRNLEDCFEKQWSGQDDFLGGDSIATTVIDGTCSLHLAGGRGCVLFPLAQNGSPRRIIPSTCRLYPLTWQNGVLKVVDVIESTCNCVDPENEGGKTLMETQSEAIADIFSDLSANCSG